jgi:enhanced disease susceptibility 1 protein
MAALLNLGDCNEVKVDLINRSCTLSMKAHDSPKKPFITEKIKNSSEAVFGFPGSWSVTGWLTDNLPFGEAKIDRSVFPSLRSVGNDEFPIGKDQRGEDEVAKLNKAFLLRFHAISKQLESEVEKANSKKKQIVFTGHSSGAPIAIIATVWYLEKYLKPHLTIIPPRCITFGSPLVGDRIFNHALIRENWSHFFIHFSTRYDIVPRLLLAPLNEQRLQQVLSSLNPKTNSGPNQPIGSIYTDVMGNVSSVASYAACHLMGNTNLLLETVSSFVELSPYRPFGTYVFCTGSGKPVVVRNPDAVLQILFYSGQLSSTAELEEVAKKSVTEHFDYLSRLQCSLETPNVVYLQNLEELPLSNDNAHHSINVTLNELGLSARARLCLRSAGEAEKQKQWNKKRVDDKKQEIEKLLDVMDGYSVRCEFHQGYYDAFKLSKDPVDFNANVKRLELAGIWDEIIEMVKRYELPDGFEGHKKWVELGTRYRRLVEPLDIANYYRHKKNEDTGPYMDKGRPKRYRYTQRWHEHANSLSAGSCSESCFWAEVEELCRRSKLKPYEEMRESILAFERNVDRWVSDKELGKEVFLEGSTFFQWWKSLPEQHQQASCIAKHFGQSQR